MNGPIERPGQLQINAWNGVLENASALPPRTPWAQVEQGRPVSRWLAPAVPVDQREWQHPDVGWGLVLPDDDALPADAKAAGADAPAPLRKLLLARPNSAVLRWAPRLGQLYLRRYYKDSPAQDLSIAAPKPGIGIGQMPRYLLIYASPQRIPWAVQYALNLSSCVGRLDLEGAALEHYVDALVSDWSGGAARPGAPVVWSVDHGEQDITWLMQRAIADRLWEQFDADSDMTGKTRLKEEQATRGALAGALAECKPGLVVTTSHGMTGPLGEPAALAAQLGMPVDAAHQPLRLEDVTAWAPGGAIWYSAACCAAGSDAASRYAGLFAPDSSVGTMLREVADTAGAMVAPLPRALLGAENPLRAFIGHVEPTFDWTLRDPVTHQVLTHMLCTALYVELFRLDPQDSQKRRTPVAYALRDVFREAGSFYGAWQEAIAGVNAGVTGTRDWALYRQLAALDRQTLVVLGDPTVALPPLH